MEPYDPLEISVAAPSTFAHLTRRTLGFKPGVSDPRDSSRVSLGIVTIPGFLQSGKIKAGRKSPLESDAFEGAS